VRSPRDVAGITTPNRDAGNDHSYQIATLIRATLATNILRPGEAWRMPPGRQIPSFPLLPTGRRHSSMEPRMPPSDPLGPGHLGSGTTEPATLPIPRTFPLASSMRTTI
jgi:hypothetical protein